MLDIVHYVVSTNVINDFEWRADKVDQAGEQYIYILQIWYYQSMFSGQKQKYIIYLRRYKMYLCKKKYQAYFRDGDAWLQHSILDNF